MKNPVKIAIVDNGINDNLINITEHLKIDENNQCIIESGSAYHQVFSHGTNCALIIRKYFPEAELYSIKILDDKGKGIIEKLEPAFDWCCEREIQLVNLSFGTTHFQDKPAIRKIVNHYANRGMIIVAAASNSGYKSFPASLSNVIGAASGDLFSVDEDFQNQRGVDFIAPSNHEISLDGITFQMETSNSYAAPFITAMIGKDFMEECRCTVSEIRRKISAVLKMGDFMSVPDWSENAWVSDKCKKSQASYYFGQLKGEFDRCESSVDTIVITDKAEFAEYKGKGKHIVYLGKDKIEPMDSYRHFWSRKQRIAQIWSSKKREADLDVPVILLKLDQMQDMFLWLSKLRECFRRSGYNGYAMAKEIECVLYDLEYLPEELCNEDSLEQIHHFLFWQTYYCQADVILFGIHDACVDRRNTFHEKLEKLVDMLIEISNFKVIGKHQHIMTKVYCDGKLEAESVLKLDDKTISLFYRDVLASLLEVEDEQ